MEFHPTFGISNRTGDTVSVDAGYRGADFTLTTSVFPLGGVCT